MSENEKQVEKQPLDHRACFVDTRGREWPLVINVLKARKIKNELGIDLLNFFSDEKSQNAVSDDPFQLLDVFYTLSNAEEKGVSPEDFFIEFNGDTVDAAQAALMEALVNFSPTRQAQVLRLLVDKTKEHQDKALKLMEEKIKTADFGS